MPDIGMMRPWDQTSSFYEASEIGEMIVHFGETPELDIVHNYRQSLKDISMQFTWMGVWSQAHQRLDI